MGRTTWYFVGFLIVCGCASTADSDVRTTAPAKAEATSFLSRPGGTHVRVLCYNINWDAIYAKDDPQNHKWRRHYKRAEFDRVVKAVDADIICVQEVNPERDGKRLAAILDEVVPVDDGAKWHTHIGNDNIIASRFPISQTATDTKPASGKGHAAGLIDLPDEHHDGDIYLINAHFKAAGGAQNIARRQQHADAIVNWLRDARQPGEYVDLPPRTSIIVLGDLNVYETDPHLHLTTLITGDIKDEDKFNSDSPPDWDGTEMTDLLPVHNGRDKENWTWRDDTQDFNPGALDRVIYSDSTMVVIKSFVLNTATMTEKELAESGLQKGDVALNLDTGLYDHLPIVFDFRLK
ncbi:MAG: endonuclease/exonuclease/phosphatase family protein [Planctomycetota bacterium]|jgi:endonuclease/exonuclease/phosphatase family metal-dependent hydrolase